MPDDAPVISASGRDREFGNLFPPNLQQQRRCVGYVILKPEHLSTWLERLPYRYRDSFCDAAVRVRLGELATLRRRFCYRRLHILLRREGIVEPQEARGANIYKPAAQWISAYSCSSLYSIGPKYPSGQCAVMTCVPLPCVSQYAQPIFVAQLFNQPLPVTARPHYFHKTLQSAGISYSRRDPRAVEVGSKANAIVANTFENVFDVVEHQFHGRVHVVPTILAEEAGGKLDADHAAGFTDCLQ
jgi:hypothetical protein